MFGNAFGPFGAGLAIAVLWLLHLNGAWADTCPSCGVTAPARRSWRANLSVGHCPTCDAQ
jgi:hypothetical protein